MALVSLLLIEHLLKKTNIALLHNKKYILILLLYWQPGNLSLGNKSNRTPIPLKLKGIFRVFAFCQLVTNIERPQRESMCTSLDRLDGSIFGLQHPLFTRSGDGGGGSGGGGGSNSNGGSKKGRFRKLSRGSSFKGGFTLDTTSKNTL